MDQLEKMHQMTRTFIEERNWGQFHTPENISKSIAIEAAELLELFQWNNDYEEERLKEELADVFIYCLQLAQLTEIDLYEAVESKFEKNRKKYPIEKSLNSNQKYTDL